MASERRDIRFTTDIFMVYDNENDDDDDDDEKSEPKNWRKKNH